MNGCILLHPNQIIKRIKRAYREIDLVIIYNKNTFNSEKGDSDVGDNK